jgi:hypothetical protein
VVYKLLAPVIPKHTTIRLPAATQVARYLLGRCRSMSPIAARFALLLVSVACGSVRMPPTPSDAPNALTSSDIDVDALHDLGLPSGNVMPAGAKFVLFGRSKPDSNVASLAELSERESGLAGRPRAVLLTSTWSKPYESYDSLIVDRTSLRPLEETVTSRRARYHYSYSGSRVIGTVTTDSSSEQVDRTFPEAVFAFNEVEILVRSLRCRSGATFVVPLFSEGDRAVEHDTLRVVSRSMSDDGRPVWTIDFADPVITTRYRVEANARVLVDAETRQRKSGVTFRLVREAKAVK